MRKHNVVRNYTVDKKRLISNFASLSSVQMANYIFPLITLPYLARVLGPEKFGLIAFAQAFVQYFVLLTDYGFNLSATRNVSIHRNDIEKVSRIFSAVMLIKFFLMLLSFAIFSALLFSIPKFRADWVLYSCCFGFVIGNMLFPVWLFQGMERMKSIAFLNLIAKTIFLGAIFVFVKSQADYLYVPLLAAIGGMVAGVLSIGIAVKRFHVHLKPVSVADVMHEFREGWYVFVSTVAISLYTTSNTFVLGIMTNSTSVAYYSAGEKLVRAGQGLWTPFSQAIFPVFSKLYADNRDGAKAFLKKILVFAGFSTFLLSLAGCLLAPPLTTILLGPKFNHSVLVVQILIFSIFAIGINNILGVQGLIAFGFSKYFTAIVAIAGVLHLALLFVLIKLYGLIGTAVAVVITELFICAIEFYLLKKKGILCANYDDFAICH